MYWKICYSARDLHIFINLSFSKSNKQLFWGYFSYTWLKVTFENFCTRIQWNLLTLWIVVKNNHFWKKNFSNEVKMSFVELRYSNSTSLNSKSNFGKNRKVGSRRSRVQTPPVVQFFPVWDVSVDHLEVFSILKYLNCKSELIQILEILSRVYYLRKHIFKEYRLCNTLLFNRNYITITI